MKDLVPLPVNEEVEGEPMKQRFFVTKNGKRFASVHAATSAEAIRIACRMTGRDPVDGEVETTDRPASGSSADAVDAADREE